MRKLKPFVEQIRESITKYIKPEDDFLYKRGQMEGKQEVINKFLTEGILTTRQIASFFEVSEEVVEQLRKEIAS